MKYQCSLLYLFPSTHSLHVYSTWVCPFCKKRKPKSSQANVDMTNSAPMDVDDETEIVQVIHKEPERYKTIGKLSVHQARVLIRDFNNQPWALQCSFQS